MNPKQYLETQLAIIEIGKKVNTLDLDSFLKALSNAETMAPMLEPGIYRKAQSNLAAIRKLAESLLPVRTAFDEVFDSVLQTAVTAYMQKEPTA